MTSEYFSEYTTCECGAITLFSHDRRSYSCLRKSLKRFVPAIDLRKVKRLHKTVNCDYCVNHYGLDLCACGSGELYEKCNNGFDECGKPMQVIGEYDRVIAKNSWLSA